LPLAALALDLGENVAIVVLVSAYPSHLARVATAQGLLTGLPFAAYLAVLVALVAVTLRPPRRAALAS
jgi:hypothetical protein